MKNPLLPILVCFCLFYHGDVIAEQPLSTYKPVLEFSTYFGSIPDVPHGKGHDMAIDQSGNIYLTGNLQSKDMPITPTALQTQFTGAFLAKLNHTGDSLLFSTYIGNPGGTTWSQGVAVDKEGYIYLIGSTNNAKFPTTAGAYDESFNGPSGHADGDAFVMKLNPQGSEIIYSTLIGGSGSEIAGKIAVDDLGYAYLVGTTSSTNFPVTPNAFSTTLNNGHQENGQTDLFIAKLNPTGSHLVYATYVGGSGSELHLGDIVIDKVGCAYIVGNTSSHDFPTTKNAYASTYMGGALDAFLIKLSTDGSELEYGSFFGGRDRDQITSLAIQTDGHIWLGGSTRSADFPTTEDAYHTKHRGQWDAFFLELSPVSNQLNYSTLLGGTASEVANVSLHDTGMLVITGQTRSPDFSYTDRLNPAALKDPSKLYLATFDPGTHTMLSISVMGGSRNEVCLKHIMTNNELYLTGMTTSSDFPITTGAYDTTNNGGERKGNIYVSKLNLTR